MFNDEANRLSRRKFLEGIGASAVACVSTSETAKTVGQAPQGMGDLIHLPRGQTAYVVASPGSDLEKRVLERLVFYLDATLRRTPRVLVDLSRVPANSPAIVLAHPGNSSVGNVTPPAGSSEGFALATRKVGLRSVVFAVGNSDRGLKRAVQRLIVNSHQSEAGLRIPVLNLSEKPWIPEREYALCGWVPRYVRGVFVNPYADERMNIWQYSGPQIAQYVEMYDWFGFSGIQLMETSYSYGILGSVEAFHARLKEFASAARRNGQNVSLWVWAAEFSHFNWIDPDVTYIPSSGHSAFNDPRVRKVFDKYYDAYAELAPYIDRLMGHFYDPGNLRDQSDVFNYMRLLESKFRARNPNIKMAIDMWAGNPDYFTKLVNNGFQHYLILEQPHWIEPAKREALHQEAKRLGLDIGMWGWDSTEYEPAQMASMYVNCQVLKEYYEGIKNGAATVYPYRYWSEMEAHHLNDIYSEYVASQLLWNPDRDPHEILHELTAGIWGTANGEKVFAALRLIEDARSGPSWHTYWWQDPQYRLGTADPADDLRRADAAVEELESMKPDPSFVPKFPLPFPPSTFVELMLPHLQQIRAFARFRLGLSDVQSAAKAGAGKKDVASRMARNWKPIPEYNTWVGTFGQIERRMQEILVLQAAKDAGVEVKAPEWLQAEDAHRLLEKIQNVQIGTRDEWRFKTKDVNEFWWPQDKLRDRLDWLIREGWVEKLPDDTYRLVNWDQYARR